jgi:hypothetical protein
LLGAGVLVIALVATLGGMVDPAPGGDRHALLPGLGFVVVELLLLFRALRLGLTVDDETVTSRGWFRTRTFVRGDVTEVGWKRRAAQPSDAGSLGLTRSTSFGLPKPTNRCWVLGLTASPSPSRATGTWMVRATLPVSLIRVRVFELLSGALV